MITPIIHTPILPILVAVIGVGAYAFYLHWRYKAMRQSGLFSWFIYLVIPAINFGGIAFLAWFLGATNIYPFMQLVGFMLLLLATANARLLEH